MFWENFWPNFLANLLVDGLIVVLVLRYLEKKDKQSEEAKKERTRKENLKVVVNMLWAEIEHNKGQLKLLITCLSKRPKPDLIYPALEVTAWEVADRQQLIDSLTPNSFADLLGIYNRTYSLNKMYYALMDKVEVIIAGKESTVKEEYIEKILFRAKELLAFIEAAIPEKVLKQKVANRKHGVVLVQDSS
jgi:hypothetical protein